MDSRYLEIILGISSLSSPKVFETRQAGFIQLEFFTLRKQTILIVPGFYKEVSSIGFFNLIIPTRVFAQSCTSASRIPHPVPNLAPFYFQVPNSLRGRRLKGEGGIWAREGERKVIPFPFPFERLPRRLGPKGFDRLCSKKQHNMLLAVLVYS